MTTTTAVSTCLLLIGDRVVLRANGPPEAEYAMFDISEIELRASEPGRVREHGYQTTAEHARGRLAHLGMTAAVAREVAQAMQPVLSDAYARGGAVRRVARYLSATELFQSEGYDITSHLYRGVFLDLASLAKDLDLEHAPATLHALYLATLLEGEADETTVLLSTDACTKGGKPGARTYKRPSFLEIQRLLNGLGGLAHRHPHPAIAEALPRADVIAFLRTRADLAPDDDARALYKSLESTVSLRDMPEKGPLASSDLWALETRIDSGDLEGIVDAIEEAERRHGRTPGTTYLRARAALNLRLEQPKLIAERVSALALSMTSFQELALLAAEAWLDAGDAKRAMPYARDLVDTHGVDEGLLLRAQRILARAVGAAPEKKQTLVDSIPAAPLPSRPPAVPSDAPTEALQESSDAQLELGVWGDALGEASDVKGGRDLEVDLVPSLPTPPPPPPLRSPAPPPPPAPPRRAPPPIPSSRPRAAPPLPSSKKIPVAKPPPELDLTQPLLDPSQSQLEREPMVFTFEKRPAQLVDLPPPEPLGLASPRASSSRPSSAPHHAPLHAREPSAPPPYPREPSPPPRRATPPPLELSLPPAHAQEGASFTLDLPGPEILPVSPGPSIPSAPPSPTSSPPSLDVPKAPRRRMSGVMMETRPPASYDPRAEPDSPIVTRAMSSVPVERPRQPEPEPRAAPARRAAPKSEPAIVESEQSAHDRPTPMRPTAPHASEVMEPVIPPIEANLDLSGLKGELDDVWSEKTPPLELAVPPRSVPPPRAFSATPSVPPERSYMHGASLPPYRLENPPPLLPKAPLLPKLGGPADELAEHLALPPGVGVEPRSLDVLPTSVLEARVQFTLLSRELGLDYRLKRGIELRADVSGIEAMQAVLLESFPDHSVRTNDEAFELRRHGAFLSEILARRLDAEWLDISPNELGYWVMIVPPDTRVWPFGRVARLIAMGHKERDLVSYFFELQSRARGR